MSFQEYPQATEDITGLTPARLVDQMLERGFVTSTRAGPILAWLDDEHGLGRGHGMAMVHVITKGPAISATHVGSEGTHHDEPTTRDLDGRGRGGSAN